MQYARGEISSLPAVDVRVSDKARAADRHVVGRLIQELRDDRFVRDECNSVGAVITCSQCRDSIARTPGLDLKIRRGQRTFLRINSERDSRSDRLGSDVEWDDRVIAIQSDIQGLPVVES